jgi:mannose-6-phosphate isomerase-like protein (cupin superfamily)
MDKALFAYARDMELVVNKTNGRHSTLIVTEEDMGAKGFIVGVHTMDPGGGAPEHVHEKEQEAMYFFSGKGIARVGGTEFNIEPDSVMLAPPGAKHSIRNTGDQPLRFVFVYCPPLPEHVSRETYFKRARDKVR